VLLSAACIGIARSALEHAVRYAKERHTFGQPIANHQGVQFMLADIAKDVEAARLLAWQAAALIDEGVPDAYSAAVSRSFSQNMAMRAATDAVQIFGGYGYSKEYPVEKLMRDAKMYQLVDGTASELHVAIGRELLAPSST
jgi:alkylation response protein AidB-like acyl-CoA dehydrogenase